MSYFISAITQHYADFSGRARRREYWMFMLLFSLSIPVVALPLGVLLAVSGNGGLPEGLALSPVALGFGLFVPFVAITVRRLHDVGKSGWFYFVSLIPLVGGIWLLVLLCTDSQPGANQYGANPKNVGAANGNTAAPVGFCSKCGSSRIAGAAFCAACGSPA